MDKETTVETVFSVWGSDEESVLNKGVGGLDPAHSDDRHVNGQEKTRERPALIRIAKNGYDVAGTKSVLSERSCSDYAGSRSYRMDPKSGRMSQSPNMARGRKRVLKDKSSIRRITSTDSPEEISRSPKNDRQQRVCFSGERLCIERAILYN